MKRLIISVTIAINAVLLTAFPGLTSTVSKVTLRQIDGVEYQSIKLESSMDAMLNPAQGGIRPMPPPPPWIPPVEEGIINKMPPKFESEASYGNYTPVHLPLSVPWIVPPLKIESQFMNIPYFSVP